MELTREVALEAIKNNLGFDTDEADTMLDESCSEYSSLSPRTNVFNVLAGMVKAGWDIDEAIGLIKNGEIVELGKDDLYNLADEAITSIDKMSGYAMLDDIGSSDVYDETVRKLKEYSKVFSAVDSYGDLCLRSEWDSYLSDAADEGLAKFQQKFFADGNEDEYNDYDDEYDDCEDDECYQTHNYEYDSFDDCYLTDED